MYRSPVASPYELQEAYSTFRVAYCVRLHFAVGRECELRKSALDCFDLDLVLGEAMQAAKWPKRVTYVAAEYNLPHACLHHPCTIVPVNRIDVR
jgi:hypothetical protein